jgi:hypothetical protein
VIVEIYRAEMSFGIIIDEAIIVVAIIIAFLLGRMKNPGFF